VRSGRTIREGFGMRAVVYGVVGARPDVEQLAGNDSCVSDAATDTVAQSDR
jgi:hypothetical protein